MIYLAQSKEVLAHPAFGPPMIVIIMSICRIKNTKRCAIYVLPGIYARRPPWITGGLVQKTAFIETRNFFPSLMYDLPATCATI